MPKRPCIGTPSRPRCPNYAEYRGRCAECSREQQRGKRNRRFYNSKKWRLTSRKKLATNPICQICDEALATQVDHIIPIEEGGDPWSMDNLQSLDAVCHGKKTRREQLA